MACETVFVDTSGFYALLTLKDRWHSEAANIFKKMQKNKTRVLTTDYVLGETATLLLARGFGHQAVKFFELIRSSSALTVHHVDADLFAAAQKFFIKNIDQGYSFTDCTSFLTMRLLKLKNALTSDAHFVRAGMKVMLSGR